MIIVVATVRVHPDKAELYEAACRDFMPRVRAANPGIVFYELGKSRDEPLTYRVVETYRDRQAMEAHMASPLLRESFARLQECIAELDVKLHDTIG